MNRFTAAELAAHLRRSVRQIQRLETLGMPFIPTGKRSKVYDPVACESWLAANLCPSDKTPKGTGTPKSASGATAYIAASQKVQVRATPNSSKPNSARPLLEIVSRS